MASDPIEADLFRLFSDHALVKTEKFHSKIKFRIAAKYFSFHQLSELA